MHSSRLSACSDCILFFFSLLLFLETGSLYMKHWHTGTVYEPAGIKLPDIHWPLPPKCWDQKHMPLAASYFLYIFLPCISSKIFYSHFLKKKYIKPVIFCCMRCLNFSVLSYSNVYSTHIEFTSYKIHISPNFCSSVPFSSKDIQPQPFWGHLAVICVFYHKPGSAIQQRTKKWKFWPMKLYIRERNKTY